MTGRGELGVVAAAMAGLSVALTWPLALHAPSALPGDLADPLLNAFTLAWDAGRAAHGFRGLWDAPFFFPSHDTLAFSDHLLGLALFTAPVQWLTGNAVLAYNLAFIGSYALAGLGAYLLARSLWQSRAAAWVAGVAFAAAPSRAMHVSHLQMLTAGWLALACWGLHAYFVSGSRRALAIFAASYLLLALSSSYLMYFAAVPIAVVLGAGLVRLARSPSSSSRLRSALVDLAAAGGVVALALAPVAAAYLRVRQATGLRRTAAELAMFSARWPDYLSIPSSLRAWSLLLPPGAPERMLFPGLAVVLLAAAAIGLEAARAKRGTADPRTPLAALIAVLLGLCVWLTFGPAVPGPYRWLLSLVPGMDALRVPARFVVVASLPLALLAARGVQLLVPRRRVAAAAVATIVIVVAEGYAGPMPLASFDPHQRERSHLNAWLRFAPPGGVIELPIAGPAFQPFTTAYQFNTLLHEHAIVNGYTGTGSALQDFLANPASPIARVAEVPAALEGLRAIGVRYLVLHRTLFERWHHWNPQPLVDAIDAESSQIVSRAQFGDALAWRLADAPPFHAPHPGGARRLLAAELSATASRNPSDARLAFDGSVATRWSTGAPQQGDEWFEVTVPPDTDVARLVFRTDRTGHSDRPRNLVVESVNAGVTARVLFDGPLVPAMIAASAGLTDGTIVALPPNSTRVLRLRQTGKGGRLYWSIYELEIYARR